MRWRSTRGGDPVTFRHALFQGLAPDGGLYLPERLSPIDAAALRGASLTDIGTAIAAHLIDGVPRGALASILRAALNFPLPLVEVAPGVQVLELFHGPTFAFKDVGARVMAGLMAQLVEPGQPLTVLVATSGDTGGAVAQAFTGVPGARVAVLYPRGQVSDVQEAQLTTAGANVQAIAVEGAFDDCQRLVKQALADAALREALGLTSANSINVGRLVPQIFYYAWGAMAGGCGVFSVPSGNFGNLTAGLMAKGLGFPVERFVAATNVNDVVPQYLATGRYAPRPSIRTIANAMDVGAPNNFERLRALAGGDLARLRDDVAGAAFDDAAIVGAIGEVYRRYGYRLDPHSAVGWLGLGGMPGIVLATAHPAKFCDIVEAATGAPVAMPQALVDVLHRQRWITPMAADFAALEAVLRDWNPAES